MQDTGVISRKTRKYQAQVHKNQKPGTEYFKILLN